MGPRDQGELTRHSTAPLLCRGKGRILLECLSCGATCQPLSGAAPEAYVDRAALGHGPSDAQARTCEALAKGAWHGQKCAGGDTQQRPE